MCHYQDDMLDFLAILFHFSCLIWINMEKFRLDFLAIYKWSVKFDSGSFVKYIPNILDWVCNSRTKYNGVLKRSKCQPSPILFHFSWWTRTRVFPINGEGERRHECGLGWDDITIKARFRGIIDTLSSYEELKFHPERLSRWNLGWISRDERESYCLIPFVSWFDFVFHLHIFLLGV